MLYFYMTGSTGYKNFQFDQNLQGPLSYMQHALNRNFIMTGMTIIKTQLSFDC